MTPKNSMMNGAPAMLQVLDTPPIQSQTLVPEADGFRFLGPRVTGPSHCWVDSFLLLWSHCTGTRSVAALDRWVICYADPCRCGFRPTGPLWYYNSYNTRRIAIVHPSWMDQAEAPADIRKQITFGSCPVWLYYYQVSKLFPQL